MASGMNARTGQLGGFVWMYGARLAGVPERVEAMLNDGWQPVYIGDNGKMTIVKVRGHASSGRCRTPRR